MTLWQKLVEAVKAMFTARNAKKNPVELRFWNPAKARIRDGVVIDESGYNGGYRGKDFYCDSFMEYTRTLRGKTIKHTAYLLSHRPLGGPVERVMLFYMPLREADGAGNEYKILLFALDPDMREDFGMEYSENLHNAVDPQREGRDDNGDLQVFDDNDPPNIIEQWWRVDDVRGAYNVRVAHVKDANRDGIVMPDEVEYEDRYYWDFWREMTSEGGYKFNEFKLFEMRKSDHWTWVWQGIELHNSQVTWRFI
jgi:hypothetical protein